MFTPRDITAGETWACRYRTTVMLGHDDKPVQNLKLGETAKGPGTVEGIGIIKTRDIERELLEVVDIQTQKTHVVAFQDVWDIDRAELIED